MANPTEERRTKSHFFSLKVTRYIPRHNTSSSVAFTMERSRDTITMVSVARCNAEGKAYAYTKARGRSRQATMALFHFALLCRNNSARSFVPARLAGISVHQNIQ